MPRHRGVQSDIDSLKNNNKNNEEKTIVSYSPSIHTFDVSMKARLKGHIAIKLYKGTEAHPTTMTKTKFSQTLRCCANVIIVPIIGKT